MGRLVNLVILVSLLTGCQSAPVRIGGPGFHAQPSPERVTTEEAGLIQQTNHSEELAGNQPNLQSESRECATSDCASNNPALQRLEQLALASNPAIGEIDAEIESLKGKLTQAGLSPNPIVGVNGEDINEDGGAGRYGVYFGREVVRGNKLELSQSVVCAEIKAAQQRRAIILQRLMTDVRQAFFDLLIVQERIRTNEQLVELSQQAVDTSEKLVEAGEIANTSLIQAKLELQNAKMFRSQSENQRRGAKRMLAALLGESELPFATVSGDVYSLATMSEFEESYDRLLSSSPEIAALFAEVEQRQRNLSRQFAEPIPNLTWQSTLQYDTASDDVVAGFQVGLPIPTLNRNQGAIYQAQQQILSAERRAERKALDLRQRLAKAYQDSIDSQIQVEAFETEIIPMAKESVELISEAYRQGELPFLQWLTAQRTYSQTQLTYLTQLQTYWNRYWDVRGMLLSGSLKD